MRPVHCQYRRRRHRWQNSCFYPAMRDCCTVHRLSFRSDSYEHVLEVGLRTVAHAAHRSQRGGTPPCWKRPQPTSGVKGGGRTGVGGSPVGHRLSWVSPQPGHSERRVH